jgi:hypothetical protein
MSMADAEDRYLEEIGRDCATALGPGSTLLAIERRDLGDRVELLARYRIGRWEAETTESGETVIDAHARLRARVLFDRIRLGFTVLVEER